MDEHNVCDGCKYDVGDYIPKDDAEFCLILDRCTKCRRCYQPAYANGYDDLYDAKKE